VTPEQCGTPRSILGLRLSAALLLKLPISFVVIFFFFLSVFPPFCVQVSIRRATSIAARVCPRIIRSVRNLLHQAILCISLGGVCLLLHRNFITAEEGVSFDSSSFDLCVVVWMRVVCCETDRSA
jgi:hypothetical protein